MLPVTMFSVNSGVKSFKANSKNNNNNKIKPCETHAYFKTKAVMVGLGVALLSPFIMRSKKLLAFAVSTSVVGLGVSAFLDKYVNKKHAQLADELSIKNPKDVLAKNKEIKTTKKGNLYYESNIGKKIGLALGAVILLAEFVKPFALKRKAPSIDLLDSLDHALTPLVHGCVADYFANKTAKSFADKN